MKLKSNIATSETGFIFNPSTGDSFSANAVGMEIISLLKKNKPLNEIKKHILDKYNVDEAVFEKDYDDYIAQLQFYNLIDTM
ncbi:MAG: PqqD family protein [Ignavibacteria bacterium]|nr:PqqD family protein [Ignavibacteria bacterium]